MFRPISIAAAGVAPPASRKLARFTRALGYPFRVTDAVPEASHPGSGREIVLRHRPHDREAALHPGRLPLEALDPSGRVLGELPQPRSSQEFTRSLRPVVERLNELYPRTAFLWADGVYYAIPCEDIAYVEALRNYVSVYGRDGELRVRSTLGNFQELLPGDCFVQPHRSFLVNVDHVRGYTTHRLRTPAGEVPISRSSRATMRERFGKLGDGYAGGATRRSTGPTETSWSTPTRTSEPGRRYAFV